MALSTWWWLLAGIAVGVELLSGTVYLLLLGLGFVAAALAAHAGASLTVQLVVAAVVSAASVVGWYYFQRGRAGSQSESMSMNLDIGETLLVDSWGADGTATVRHRGAQWTAVTRPGAATQTGLHRVVEVIGNRLVLEPV